MKINLKNQTGSITLDSGHALLVGNIPKGITNEVFTDVITKEPKLNLESFGLWETSTPNYNTYYPDVTADDLLPREEDFVYPIFRALSATVVWKGYRPIDFSKAGVLKAGMNLLVGQSVIAEHENILSNAMGAVKSVVWQESYTADGVKVPAGINAEYKIDGKSNPRIARGIMMDPPAIHSTSVSVQFEWEPSHKMNSNDEFYSKLGTLDEKGNLYRLIVTKIIKFTETSLVPHGADPYAQIIKDGKINNPTYANSVYNFSSTDEKGRDLKITHVLDYKTDLTLSADEDITTPFKINNNNNSDEKKFTMNLLEFLEVKLGLSKGSLTDDNAQVEIAKFFTNNDQALKDKDVEIEKLTGEKETAETALAEAKPKVEKFDALALQEKEDVKELYKKLKGDDAKDSIIKLIDESTPDSLVALKEEYEIELDEKFPAKCSSCGEVATLSRASSVNDDDDDKEDKGKSKKKETLSISSAKQTARETYLADQKKSNNKV